MRGYAYSYLAGGIERIVYMFMRYIGLVYANACPSLAPARAGGGSVWQAIRLPPLASTPV
jgi:hypothetical protein